MFTIKSPVKGYTGAGFGLHFVNGEAKTENRQTAEYLKKKGYTVAYEPIQTPKKSPIREEADALGITYSPNIGDDKLKERIEDFKASKSGEKENG